MLFLHGGPGSGCNPGQRGLFDPTRDLVIFLDQRGAGKSLPPRSRTANTLPHQITDLELVRRHLGIATWMVVGGSWGATLALAYAQAHPERVRAMALRAVFLGTRAELESAFGPRLAAFSPALYREFLAPLSPEERGDPLSAHWRRILDADPQRHRPAAWLWHDIERALAEAPRPAGPLFDRSPEPALPATPFMKAHYFSADCFLAPEALLRGAERLADIPGILLQGRCDLLCPPEMAAALAARWPKARLEIVEGAGHGLDHPAIFAGLKAAITELQED